MPTNIPTPRRHVALVGPTASGKSALAFLVAQQITDFEIVAVDSMQVYRGMDIGTAKATRAEQDAVPHHLIDLVDADTEFTLSDFQSAARAVIADIERRNKRAMLVGGTGLYIQSITDGLELPGQFPEARSMLEGEADDVLYAKLQQLDPTAATRTEPGNRRRILRALEVTIGSGRPFSSYGPGIKEFPTTNFHIVGLWLPRAEGGRRIEERVVAMLQAGWLEEVRHLRDTGLSRSASQALGYKELLAQLDGTLAASPAGLAALPGGVAASPGGLSGSEAVRAEIVKRTRSFARRQRVWFRRDPRITWLGHPSAPDALLPWLLRECQAGFGSQ